MQINKPDAPAYAPAASALKFVHPAVLRAISDRDIQNQERQAVQDHQHSFKSGNLSREYMAIVRACEAVFVRECPGNHPIMRKARTLAWAGLSLFDLPTWTNTLPILDSYATQADNDGERRLALKAKALVLSLIEDGRGRSWS